MLYAKGFIIPPHQMRARTRLISDSRSTNHPGGPFPHIEAESLQRLAQHEDGEILTVFNAGVHGIDPHPGRASRAGFLWRRLVLTFLVLLSSGVLAGLFVFEDRIHAALRHFPADMTVHTSGAEIGNLAFNETRFRTKSGKGGLSSLDPGPRVAITKNASGTLNRASRATPPNLATRLTVQRSPSLARFPLIDRARLAAKLGGLSEYYENEYDSRDGEDLERTPRQVQRWPPMITRIPESSRSSPRKASSPSSSPNSYSTPPPSIRPFLVDHSDRRRGGGVPSPKFLLPLRIAEQESKARVHFLQLVQLAHQLNRTLVLPNVAKSRMGACYKWPFEVYYDSIALSLEEPEQLRTPRYIPLEAFKTWSEYYHAMKGEKPNSQLISFASSIPPTIAPSPFSFNSSSSPPITSLVEGGSATLHLYRTNLAPPTEFPGCFLSKFAGLELDPTSIYVVVDDRHRDRQHTSMVVQGVSSPSLKEGEESKEEEAEQILRSDRADDSRESLVQTLKGGLSRKSGCRPGGRKVPRVAGNTGRLGGQGEEHGGVSDSGQQPMQPQPNRDAAGDDQAMEEEPDVLIVNWDLRRPIFDLSPRPAPIPPPITAPSKEESLIPTTLAYSPHLHTLARLLSPNPHDHDSLTASANEADTSYIAIHWRMETVPLNVLEDCAYSLISVLSNILSELDLEFKASSSSNKRKKTKVWLATDFPHPLSPRTSKAPIPKSGTFKTFNTSTHERALRILKSAFEPSSYPKPDSDSTLEPQVRKGQDWLEWPEAASGGGGELFERAELVDISSSIDKAHPSSSWNTDSGISTLTTDELLEDPGVLGILDKLVLIRAGWFVSGSKRCSRQSSFTRQVIETRQANMKGQRNVVTLF